MTIYEALDAVIASGSGAAGKQARHESAQALLDRTKVYFFFRRSCGMRTLYSKDYRVSGLGIVGFRLDMQNYSGATMKNGSIMELPMAGWELTP